MKKEYDFSKARRNPYAKRLKRQLTIRLDFDQRRPERSLGRTELHRDRDTASETKVPGGAANKRIPRVETREVRELFPDLLRCRGDIECKRETPHPAGTG